MDSNRNDIRSLAFLQANKLNNKVNDNSGARLEWFCLCRCQTNPAFYSNQKDILGHPTTRFERKKPYDIFYDGDTKCNVYVLEYVTQKDLIRGGPDCNRDNMYYEKDPDIALPQSTRTDFRRTSYERGHTAASANHICDYKSMSECYLYTNILPMWKDLNHGLWKDLEEQIRNIIQVYHISAFLKTGPIFCEHPKKIGDNVYVPDFLFKAIAYEVKPNELYYLECYVFENTSNNSGCLHQFRVSREDLELRTGFKIFPNLQRVEACCLHQDMSSESLCNKELRRRPRGG